MVFAVSGLVAMVVFIGTIAVLATRRGTLTRTQALFYQTALYTVLAIIVFSALAYAFAAQKIDITVILLLAALGLYFISRESRVMESASRANMRTMQQGLAAMRAQRESQPTPPAAKPSQFMDNAGRTFALRRAENGDTLTLSAYTAGDAENPPVAIAYLDLTFKQEYGEMLATLSDMFVREEYRGAGIGAHLLEAAEGAARQQNISKIVGHSDDMSFWAHQASNGWLIEDNRFYKKL